VILMTAKKKEAEKIPSPTRSMFDILNNVVTTHSKSFH